MLYGSLVDQAALYRVLLKIRNLGLVLLSLETDELLSNQGKQLGKKALAPSPSSAFFAKGSRCKKNGSVIFRKDEKIL